MLVLFETPAGHALFKLLDDGAVRDAAVQDMESETAIKSIVQLKAFSRFADTTAALAAATALAEGKPSKDLRKFLKKQAAPDETIAVADPKLGQAIKDKIGLQCVFSQKVADIMRGIRANLDVLLEDHQSQLDTGALASRGQSSESFPRKAMVLGLAHSLSRYKLKFSPDKVDTMIVQAIGLLDDLDKEINTYAMRLREWYGWHFPELAKIISDNVAYARTVKLMGVRSNAKSHDFSSILTEDTEEELKQAAQVSMGTEISAEDVLNIGALCDQVITLSEYRYTLSEYLRNRMAAISPNLTAMVGELVGARLIAHAGSLLNLAKYPASTVQILGAEKALFRALKTKHATPKYGLIFHASVVGQAAPKHKGKIARSLAAKCSLSARVDALGDAGEDATVGIRGGEAIEARLRQLSGNQEFAISRLARSGEKTPKYKPGENAGVGYNDAMDITNFNANGGSHRNGKSEPSSFDDTTMQNVADRMPSSTKKEGSSSKDKKKSKKSESRIEMPDEPDATERSKKKRKSGEIPMTPTGTSDGERSGKKRKSMETPTTSDAGAGEHDSSEKKSKKKRRSSEPTGLF